MDQYRRKPVQRRLSVRGNHLSAVSAYGETIHRSYRSFLISRICRDRNGRKEGRGKKRRKMEAGRA
jgi:hypothetical protein